MKKKIGLLGGSFDPIHLGHVNLAIELKEKAALDEVWLIPTQTNPHKIHLTTTSVIHRLNMIHLAIEGAPGLFLNDIETRRPAPSYTLDTLKILIKIAEDQLLEHEYYLLLGEDIIAGFYRWHCPDKIVSIVPLLIGSRTCSESLLLPFENESIRQAIKKGLVNTRLMDIKSSDVRDRLSKGLYCGHLLSASVCKYIQNQSLYIQSD